MSKITRRSFVSGELDDALHQRADLAKYQTGLVKCSNFLIRPQGGVYNRPGTRFIAEVDDSTSATRLIPFQFNTEQAYVLEFSDQKMRVYRNGGLVLVGAGPAIFELATPYLEADLFDLAYSQTADVLTITHRDYAARDLSRTDHDAWSLDVIDFASSVTPPTFASSTVLNVTAATNANPCVVTTDGSGDIETGMRVTFASVGGMTELNGNSYIVTLVDVFPDKFSLDGIDSTAFGVYTSGGTVDIPNITTVGSGGGDFNKTYRYVITAIDGNGIESLESVEASITAKSLSQTFGVRLSWDVIPGATFYKIYKDPSNGSGIYGLIGDSITTQFDDFNIAPDISVTPPKENTPISTAGNYPGTVGFYQQRKLFANTDNNPQTLFATQVGNFESLRSSTPTRDDDAITFTIASRQVNEIRHIVALDDLILLTSGAEYRVTEGQDFVLTPSTIGAKVQSYAGSSRVQPAVVNDSVIFIQEKGNRVRNLKYTIAAARTTTSDLSLLAEHLFEDRTIVEMAYAAEPYGILWCVMSDGAVIGMTYQVEHEIAGWHRHEFSGGIVESVAVISESGRDAPYFVVRRTVDGNTVRYVERMEPRLDKAAEDAFFVDSGLSYDGAPATVISGLEHLEGEEVIVLSDGNVVRDLVVTAGAITLPREASKVHVGLSYLSDIETFGLDSTETTLQGRKKSVSELIMRIFRSRGGWAGPDFDNLIEIKPRFDTDGYGTIALKTEERRVNLTADWNDDGAVVVRQIDPLPMAILAITPEFDIGG